MKKFISLLTLIVPLFVMAQMEPEQLQQIDSIIESKIKRNHPGIAVGILKDGNIIYEKYHGLSNLTHRIKFSATTRSNIASTAKQFTALMVLDLALKEQLSLEDDIRTYIPDLYPEVKDTIRIRHVINNTSGIPDYVALMDLQGEAWWTRVGLKNNDVMKLLKKQTELGFNPGSQYSYSNSGYIVLTKIIETVTGEKFTDYSKTFFEGLGMMNTNFIVGYMRVIPERADPYSDWGSGIWFQAPTVTKVAGDGGLYTTLNDQLIYEQLLQNAVKDNNELLIQSQLPIPNSEITTYGYGLRLFNWFNGDRSSVHHDGGTNGYNSQTLRFIDEGLSVFVMSNNGNIGSDVIADDVSKVLLPEIALGKKEEKRYDEQYYTFKDTTNQSYVIGQYVSPKNTLIRIVEEDGKIIFKRGGNVSIELINESASKFHPYYNPDNKLIFYKDEMILYELSGETTVFKRSTALPASQNDLENFVGTYYCKALDMSFNLHLTKANEMKIKFSNREDERYVTVLNKNELLSRNFTFKVKYDPYNRPTEMLVSLGRALNNKFYKKTNLKFQSQIKIDNGSIQVTTIPSRDGKSSDILLTSNYLNGNEIWSKRLGGSSYDKASSILNTEDGYLIIGSTSSYGNGNYDVYVIKTDKKGKQLWENTYGSFYNDYGFTGMVTNSGYLIKGSKQTCENNTDINRKCTSNVWFVEIDMNGTQLSESLMEEIHLK